MIHGEDSRYVRNHEYSRTSGIPQLHAPSTPLIYDSDNASHEDATVATHVFQEGDFACPNFFIKVDMDYFNTNFKSKDWNYNMRRGAQQILPCIYLGPSSVLKDLDFLSETGFTLLLAVRSKQSALARLVSGEIPAKKLGIEADYIDVTDSQELIHVFPRAIRRMNDHLSSDEPGKEGTWPPKKIFVFCESGNERSAMVVIAYVMVMFNLDLVCATNMVQQRRFSISMEEKSRQLMMNFESIIVAMRDVEDTRRTLSVPRPTNISKKRSHSDFHDDSGNDDDMDIDESEDSLAPNRKPLAPFKDR